MRYWKLMAEYVGEDTSFTTVTGGAKASPFTPKTKGRLIGLRSIMNRQAATSLTNHVVWRLSCSSFTPNVMEVGGQGSGLQTAPAIQAAPIDWDFDQPVDTVPVDIEAKCVGDTAVTMSCFLYGLFEV